jgi:putative transposase
MDNVVIERLWGSTSRRPAANCERIHLLAYGPGTEARAGIGRWMDHFNFDRPSAHRGRSPVEVHEEVGDIGSAA